MKEFNIERVTLKSKGVEKQDAAVTALNKKL
jgi:hypothetical protein